MPESPPIPAAIWRRLLLFLKEEKTGQITFEVRHGAVKDVTIQERIKAEEDAPRDVTPTRAHQA